MRIHAAKRSFSVFGEFQYNVMSGGEIVDKRVMMKNKNIFALYQSRQRKEITKTRNPLTKYFIIAVLLFLASFFTLKYTFFKDTKKNVDTVKGYNIKKSLSSSPDSSNPSAVPSPRVYYYLLSLVTVTNPDKSLSFYYTDHVLNQLMPIEFLIDPVLTIKKGNFVKKYVACTSPDPRFIPTKFNENENGRYTDNASDEISE